MLYFVYHSSFFPTSSEEELGKLAEFFIIDRSVNVMIVESESDLCGLVERKKPVFIYGAFALIRKGRISKTNYLKSIYKVAKSAVSSARPGKDPILLECFNINNRTQYSAKDIEVKIGGMLNEDGYNAEILSPKYFLYFVLLNGTCYSGIKKIDAAWQRPLNPLRRYMNEKKISRAEFKIREAFEEFGIKGKGTAIDIGAAPGGWSFFLATHNYGVIAIDTANLSCKDMRTHGARVAVLKNKGKFSTPKTGSILHIKSRSENMHERIPKNSVSLLVDDMNISPKESASIAVSYAKFLKPGAELIFTVKCISRNAPRFINEAKSALRPKFVVKGVRALPSNRQEVTLYAVCKGNFKTAKL